MQKTISVSIGYLFFCLFSVHLHAKQTSGPTLSYRTCMESVLRHHPVAKQADLLLEKADAQQRWARGGLDPEIKSEYQQKQYADKEYYTKYATLLSIPTSTGLSVVAGIQNSSGNYLNPENYIAYEPLWFLGAELDVLQGLLMNERKLALRQAEVFSEMATNDKELLLNQILYNASQAYLSWQQFCAIDSVLQENIEIAAQYFDNTKKAYLGGEKTAMDTLEAYIGKQDAITSRQKNKLSLIKSKKFLESFLWYEDQAMELYENVSPQWEPPLEIPQTRLLLNSEELLEIPSIRSYALKKKSLGYELRWKKEKLKPKLKLKYNALLSDPNAGNILDYNTDNYNWGLGFQMPLFLRSERGDLKLSQLKIKQTELEMATKRFQLQTKIEASLEQQNVLTDQISLLRKNVLGYKQLLDGENIKFLHGESSVFLLNKRQEKYTLSQIKLIEAQIKNQNEVLNYLYFTNTLRRTIF